MASAVISVVGSAIINALAFTGGGYLFNHLDKNGSLEEQKRHNQAIEQYNKAKECYNEKRQNYLDYINKELYKQNISHRDFQNVDEAMDLYNSLTNIEKIYLPNKPKLSDYYTPSNEQKKYEIIWILGGTILVIFITYKYSNKL